MLEVVLLSLVFGSVVAILALGFSFTYRFEGYINFNHVAVFLIGSYLGWMFCSYLEIGRLLSLFIIVIISALVGLMFYLPTSFLKDRYNKILFSIAVLAFVHGCMRLIFGKTRTMPKPSEGLMIGETLINSTSLMSILFLLLVLILIYMFIKRLKFGKAFIAVLDDEKTAQTIGINLRLVRFYSIIGASILSGVSGLLFSLNIGKASLDMMPGFKAMAIAIIGNFGAGLTIAAAFIILLLENFARIYLPMSEYYSHFIIFAILLLVILFRIPKRGRI